jgi:hypothetical protein
LRSVQGAGVHTAPHTEKVPAEFERMPGKDVVVYVWAPPDVMWDYPKIRLDLAANLSAYLRANVKKARIVDPLQVEAFLEQSRRAEREPLEIAKEFKADMVVHVSVFNFTTRDPGMPHFFRGRLSASVVAFDLTVPAEQDRRIPLKDVIVSVPEEGPLGYHNVTSEQIRQLTYDAFTVAVGRKFHVYERELE